MDKVQKLSECLRAISHPARIKILDLLSDYNQCLCVSDIVKKIKISQSAVSQHLILLKDKGILIRESQGVKACYRIKSDVIKDFVRTMMDVCKKMS